MGAQRELPTRSAQTQEVQSTFAVQQPVQLIGSEPGIDRVDIFEAKALSITEREARGHEHHMARVQAAESSVSCIGKHR